MRKHNKTKTNELVKSPGRNASLGIKGIKATVAMNPEKVLKKEAAAVAFFQKNPPKRPAAHHRSHEGQPDGYGLGFG